MGKAKNYRDPRGHSLRIYDDVYDSAAFAALSPYDVMAYLALLRELRQYNNGDLSLPLTRAKKCGIKHHVTLARSLRALCAVGLIAVTRTGGCTQKGQRLSSLYRVTDRECYPIPAKHISAQAATDDWKRVTSVEHGLRLIAEAEHKAAQASAPKRQAIKSALERRAKTKAQGYGVTATRTLSDMKKAATRTSCDIKDSRPGHGMTMDENDEIPAYMRVRDEFTAEIEGMVHRTPRVPSLHSCQSSASFDRSFDSNKTRQRAVENLADLWASTGCRSNWNHPSNRHHTSNQRHSLWQHD